MANKEIKTLINVDKKIFIEKLHNNGLSLRKLDDPDGKKGIWRTEKTIRRWLDRGKMPMELYLNIMSYMNKKKGEVSDGYHTFNQLYHQRAVLFATIVNLFPDKSWKTWKHEDGNYCFDKGGEWFLVSIETPEGVYGYHYKKEYWNMFNCQEIEKAKHWDGYTEEDVTRLLSLKMKGYK